MDYHGFSEWSFSDIIEVSSRFIEQFLGTMTLKAVGLVIIGFFGKTLATALYNVFMSKKILGDIMKNSKIKQIIQRSEYVRILSGADRILVTQIHNGEQWVSKNHIWKLSVFQELSIDDTHGQFRSKIFDKQLDSVLLNKLAPLIEGVTTVPVDYVSVAELDKNFPFYKHLRIEKINYIVVSQITHKNELFGYLFILFCDGKVPNRDKEIIKNIKILSNQIGEVLK